MLNNGKIQHLQMFAVHIWTVTSSLTRIPEKEGKKNYNKLVDLKLYDLP